MSLCCPYVVSVNQAYCVLCVNIGIPKNVEKIDSEGKVILRYN